MKKVIIIKQANKEIKKFPPRAQAQIMAMFDILERDGKLVEPFGKKLDHELFEIRIKYQGQWRAIYAYFEESYIFILSGFHKKTQKTPNKELVKAKQRLERYKK